MWSWMLWGVMALAVIPKGSLSLSCLSCWHSDIITDNDFVRNYYQSLMQGSNNPVCKTGVGMISKPCNTYTQSDFYDGTGHATNYKMACHEEEAQLRISSFGSTLIFPMWYRGCASIPADHPLDCTSDLKDNDKSFTSLVHRRVGDGDISGTVCYCDTDQCNVNQSPRPIPPRPIPTRRPYPGHPSERRTTSKPHYNTASALQLSAWINVLVLLAVVMMLFNRG